jgi:hypothetical protein
MCTRDFPPVGYNNLSRLPREGISRKRA